MAGHYDRNPFDEEEEVNPFSVSVSPSISMNRWMFGVGHVLFLLLIVWGCNSVCSSVEQFEFEVEGKGFDDDLT